MSFWFFNHAWESLLKGMEFDTTHFITDVSGKYLRLWALKGAHPVTVNRWYKFGALASIRTVAPKRTHHQEKEDTDRRRIWSHAEEKKSSRAPSKKIRHAHRQATNRTNSPAGSHD
ncbi:hypothetical protein ACS0TY_029600 [Phlomoides rotata]